MANKTQLKTKIESVLEDPRAQAIALVYADALLDAVPSDKSEGLLEEFTSFIDDVVKKNADFAALLVSRMVSREDKLALIERVIAPAGSELFTNFLRVLARHDRLDLLPVILNQTRQQHELRTGQKRVQVTSAQPLSAESLKSIEQSLASSFSIRPIIETVVAPEILGGLRIRVGDTVYDSSLQTRLKQLQHSMHKRSLNEIQSGRDRFSHSERD